MHASAYGSVQARTDEAKAVRAREHFLPVTEALQRHERALAQDLLVAVKVPSGDEALAFARDARGNGEALRDVAPATRRLNCRKELHSRAQA